MNAKTKKLVFVSIVASLVLSIGLLAAGAAPQYGGTLVLATTADPPNLDPTRHTCVASAQINFHVGEALFFLTLEGEVKPSLAIGYEVCENGLLWTLALREGVKFHDGTPFNAEAVKFNLERFLAIGQFEGARPAIFRFLLAMIVKVEVLDEYTVVLHTNATFAPLKAHLTHAFTVILSPTAIKALEENAVIDEPIGTGPFKFKEWVRGDHITLVANEHYWGGRPYLDKIIVRPIPEEATRIMMLEAGEVDVIVTVPPMDRPRLDADPAINFIIIPGLGTDYIGLNNFRGPFSDVRVRHAVNYAIDRELFIEYILGGLGTVATGPISPVVAGYHTAGPWPFNPERAKELLAEAGFPDGFQTTLRVTPPRLLQAEAVQADLRDVGIKAEIIVTEWAAFLAAIILPPEESIMDMFMLGWITVTGDADYGLFPLFHSSQWAPVGVNRVFYKNERVDELLDAARVTLIPEERNALYAEAIELIWQDAPWVFMFHRVESRAELVHVQGVVYRPDLVLCFRSAWIKR